MKNGDPNGRGEGVGANEYMEFWGYVGRQPILEIPKARGVQIMEAICTWYVMDIFYINRPLHCHIGAKIITVDSQSDLRMLL